MVRNFVSCGKNVCFGINHRTKWRPHFKMTALPQAVKPIGNTENVQLHPILGLDSEIELRN